MSAVSMHLCLESHTFNTDAVCSIKSMQCSMALNVDRTSSYQDCSSLQSSTAEELLKLVYTAKVIAK